MKKKIISTALSIAMAASLAGCAVAPEEQAASGDGEVQVGIVLPTRDEPRWIQDEASFTSILGDAGFTSEVLFSQGNSATELTNVESLIEKGIDVLVICDRVSCRIMTDNYLAGRMAGEQAARNNDGNLVVGIVNYDVNSANGHPLHSDHIDTTTTYVSVSNMYEPDIQRMIFRFDEPG